MTIFRASRGRSEGTAMSEGTTARKIIAIRARMGRDAAKSAFLAGRCCGGRLSAQEALPAKHGTALSRLERYGRLAPALRANRHRLNLTRSRSAALPL